MPTRIEVSCADIVDYPCDVVVLKYAQGFHGVDALVEKKLSSTRYGKPNISPAPGEYVLLTSNKQLAARHIMFVGVSALYSFEYKQIREFAFRAMEILRDQAEEMPFLRHVAMTMHGVGYGLDEREAFLSQIAGLLEATRRGIIPPTITNITIVEKDPSRAGRLRQILDAYLPAEDHSTPEPKLDAGLKSGAKPHVFVAMPFGADMDDVYVFGIQGPVNSAGYLCERVDQHAFTGDILGRIKARIETAALVIADLSGANPNVYLEVGYSWGRQRPTLLIVKNVEELKFDVKGERCIVYKNIKDLADKLKADLSELVKELPA